MRDQDHRRSARAEMRGEPARGLLPGAGIHARAGFVEHQAERIGDERPGHEHLLPLPLRQDAEGPIGERCTAEPVEFRSRWARARPSGHRPPRSRSRRPGCAGPTARSRRHPTRTGQARPWIRIVPHTPGAAGRSEKPWPRTRTVFQPECPVPTTADRRRRGGCKKAHSRFRTPAANEPNSDPIRTVL